MFKWNICTQYICDTTFCKNYWQLSQLELSPAG